MVPSISIGSTVRIKSKVIVSRPKRSDITLTICRRAIVATSPDNGNVSLVVDDLAPTPLQSSNKFIIAPIFKSKNEDEEVEVPISDLIPLLGFEKEDKPTNNNTDDIDVLVQQYKDYGDQLLRLNDYTCAISYYEAALHLVSTKVDIGGTIIVNKEGHAVIAEVDYVDDEESNYDITLPSGDESTITQKDVLLVVWMKDSSFLQVKILLNLCRCLLKLADVDNTRGHTIWAKQAIKGCSVALTLCEYHVSESSNEKTTSELTSLIEKTRIVRARAFIRLSKLKNATVDAKKVLAINSTNREAQSLLSEIKVVEAYNKSLDKKISKEVCRWVQTATSSTEGSSAMDRMNDSVSEEPGEETVNKSVEENPKSTSSVEEKRFVTSLEIWGVVVLVLAILIHRYGG